MMLTPYLSGVFTLSELRLVLVDLIRGPLPAAAEVSPLSQRLLRLGNAWLRRRAAGVEDALMLIGHGVGAEEEFRAGLAAYGLAEVKLAVLDDEVHPDDMGAEIARVVNLLVLPAASTCIPLTQIPPSLATWGYPPEVWWLGLTGSSDRAAVWVDSLTDAAPEPFCKQAATWATLLVELLDIDEDHVGMAEFADGLAFAALARWLTAFSAASGDQFFDFEYGSACANFGLDSFCLGVDAGRKLGDEVVEAGDGEEVDALALRAVSGLLRTNRCLDISLLRNYFGDGGKLFYSLYASIWPAAERPVGYHCAEVCDSEFWHDRELDAAWRLVCFDDWGGVDDSD